ncbi:hypothetical protein D9M71_640820 [compost metagenome]
MTESDVAQQVAGVEVAVTLDEHVVQHDFFGLVRVGVTIQRCLVVDPGQEQPLLALADLAHETIGAAGRRTAVMVIRRQLPGHQRKTHGIVEIEDVGKADVAVTGGIQLADMLDREACLELGPGAGTQTVADHLGHAVLTVVGTGRLVDQVAT